jgi:hypothetical protein
MSHMPIHRLAHKSVDNRVKHFDTSPARFAPRRYIYVAIEYVAIEGKGPACTHRVAMPPSTIRDERANAPSRAGTAEGA